MGPSLPFADLISHARRIYRQLLTSRCDCGPEDLIHLLTPPPELARACRRETSRSIARRLPAYAADLPRLRRRKAVAVYEAVAPRFTTFLLLQAWHDGLDLSARQQAALAEAVALGCLGYRIVDLCNDSTELGPAARFLGLALIQAQEALLLDVFRPEAALPVLRAHTALYHRAEYLEARHRWQPCPFRWERPHELGWKTAPLVAFFELVLRAARSDPARLDDLREGFFRLAAAVQMVDDFADAAADLAGGVETLVTSGFYEAAGRSLAVRPEQVERFLDAARTRRFYEVTDGLIREARRRFAAHGEPVLELYLEFAVQRLHEGAEFVPTNKRRPSCSHASSAC